MSSKLAFVCGLTAVLLWSTSGTAFKLTLAGLDPLQTLLGACVISLVCLLCVQTCRGGLSELFALSRSDVLRAAVLGFFNPFLYYFILFKAYALLPAQIAQPINYTWAIMIALLSVPFLGQRLTGRELAAMFAAYLGVVIIATSGLLAFSGSAGSGVGPEGLAYAVASTVIWAGYWIANARSRVDPTLNLILNTAFALPWVLAATLIFSSLPPFTLGGVLGSVYIGLFEMGITSLLWLLALRHSDSAARIATLIFINPFLSLLWFRLILHEPIAPTTFAGLILVVGGSVLQQRFARQRSGHGSRS